MGVSAVADIHEAFFLFGIGSSIDVTPITHVLLVLVVERISNDDLETTFAQLTKVPAIISPVQAGASSPNPMIGIAYRHLQPAFERVPSRTHRTLCCASLYAAPSMLELVLSDIGTDLGHLTPRYLNVGRDCL
jgi:hypothetical protein